MKMETIRSFTLLCISLLSFFSVHGNAFDARQHLSTVTRYQASRNISNADSSNYPIPDGCEAIHMNLVSRHGTRSPTIKHIIELDELATRFEVLIEEAKQSGSSEAYKIPGWMQGWESPWKGRATGGELIDLGEQELYQLGLRVRHQFPEIFSSDYHSDIYPIKSTQVPRAAASAVAFGTGLFSGKGTLGPAHQRAFSVVSESLDNDIWLRFFDECTTYEAYKKSEKPKVKKLQKPILEEITSALVSRHHLNFTRQDVESLWFLCKQEASLLDITNQACGLFNETEIYLLEWTDDLELFLLKGYGNSINYWMGVPLLKTIYQSMQDAIQAKENQTSGMYERALLQFAHAETIVPFSCLLGLFLEGDEYEKIQRGESLDQPPKPPQKRNWTGSLVSPFAGNNMIVLYQCPNKEQGQTYHVQVLHNEVPVVLPGCGTHFCSFEVFKEQVVEPNLKHEFNSTCNVKSAAGDAVVEVPKSFSWSRKLSKFMTGLF